MGEGADHKGVPGGEPLVVEAGARAEISHPEKDRARLAESLRRRRVRAGDLREWPLEVEDVQAAAPARGGISEVSTGLHSVHLAKQLAIVRAERRHDLGLAPEVVLALFPFAVRVERGVESS